MELWKSHKLLLSRGKSRKLNTDGLNPLLVTTVSSRVSWQESLGSHIHFTHPVNTFFRDLQSRLFTGGLWTCQQECVVHVQLCVCEQAWAVREYYMMVWRNVKLLLVCLILDRNRKKRVTSVSTPSSGIIQEWAFLTSISVEAYWHHKSTHFLSVYILCSFSCFLKQNPTPTAPCKVLPNIPNSSSSIPAGCSGIEAYVAFRKWDLASENNSSPFYHHPLYALPKAWMGC